MIAVFAILIFTIYLCFLFPIAPKKKPEEEKSPKYTAQMKKLWQVAQTSMKDRKLFRAEKALLTILKFDEKNAAAYNRLGILYAKSQKYNEAVECFEIAQSLDNNPASIHNVGLIYLETGAYEKAAMAFRQAIAAEGGVSARHIALAKAEEKMGNMKKSIEALEDAFELDPKIATLRQILTIYEGMGDTEAVSVMSTRIEEQIAKNAEKKHLANTTKKSPTRAKEKVRASTKTVTPKLSMKNKTTRVTRTVAPNVASTATVGGVKTRAQKIRANSKRIK